MAYQLKYLNKGTRDQPLSAELEKIYQDAAIASGIDAIRVMSGGQPSSGPNRTGSHRHDDGGAGDIMFERGGKVLEFTNPEDLPYIQKWIANAKAGGLTGFGAGEQYMGNKTIHAGGGSEATWGPGGTGKTTPDWLRQAISMNSTPVAQSTATADATPESTATEKIKSFLGGEDGKDKGSGLEGIETLISGIQGSAPNPETSQITPASISNEPAINPAAQQMLASLIQNRRNKYGTNLMGMPS